MKRKYNFVSVDRTTEDMHDSSKSFSSCLFLPVVPLSYYCPCSGVKDLKSVGKSLCLLLLVHLRFGGNKRKKLQG